MQQPPKTRRYFTEAAREAAARARRQKGAERLADADKTKLVVHVIRAAEPSNRFGWEIRRFGALMPVRRSVDWYESPREAMAFGKAMLPSLNDEGARAGASASALVAAAGWNATTG